MKAWILVITKFYVGQVHDQNSNVFATAWTSKELAYKMARKHLIEYVYNFDAPVRNLIKNLAALDNYENDKIIVELINHFHKITDKSKPYSAYQIQIIESTILGSAFD